MLDLTKEDLRVQTAAEDGTVVSKGDAKGWSLVDELDGLVKGKGPEGRRTDPPPGGSPSPLYGTSREGHGDRSCYGEGGSRCTTQ